MPIFVEKGCEEVHLLHWSFFQRQILTRKWLCSRNLQQLANPENYAAQSRICAKFFYRKFLVLNSFRSIKLFYKEVMIIPNTMAFLYCEKKISLPHKFSRAAPPYRKTPDYIHTPTILLCVSSVWVPETRSTHDKLVHCHNAATGQACWFHIQVPYLPADNPQQSEECSHTW